MRTLLEKLLKIAVLTVSLLLEVPVKSEETSVLAPATVLSSGALYNQGVKSADYLINQSFLAFLHIGSGSPAFYKIQFGRSIVARTVFVVNTPGTMALRKRMSTTKMCMGTAADPQPPPDSDCKMIYDTGIYSNLYETGTMLSFYAYTSDLYSLMEVRVYQALNVIGDATVITDYEPAESYLGPNNLITNLESRTHKYNEKPRINAANEVGDFYSCFSVWSSEIINGVYVLGFDHGRAIFQHFVTMVQNSILQQQSSLSATHLAEHYTALWEVYIGDSLTYSDNPKCAGGPFLKSTYDDYYSDSSILDKKVPAFGFEAECNLEGQYTFLVATHVPTISVSICSVLVIGTFYSRPDPLLSTIEMTPVQLKYTVINITPDQALGNELDIRLRQKTGFQLDFVTITELSDRTELIIDGTGLVPGATYALTFESVDANSSVQSTLKTETIEISIAEAVRDTPLTSELKVQVGKRQTLDVAFVRTADSIAAQDSVTITQDLSINLRQKPGEELSFVSFVEQSDHTDVVINAAQLTLDESHTLVIESFDTNGGPSFPTLHTEKITISVVEAERTNAAPTDVKAQAGNHLSYRVDHCTINSEVSKNNDVSFDYPTLEVNLRQQAGTELSWISFVENTGYTDVVIDTNEIESGKMYTLYLESFHPKVPSNSPYKTDTVTIAVLEAVRAEPVTPELKVQAGFHLTLDVPHAQMPSEVTDQAAPTFNLNPLTVNLRQKSGEELSFVSFVEQSDHTDVMIDSSKLSIGETYTLVLESMNADYLEGVPVRTDTIVISIVEAEHSTPIPTDVKVQAAGSVEVFVPHATISEEVTGQNKVTMNPLAVTIRQKAGAEHAWVTLEGSATQTVVTLSAEDLIAGFTETVILESFDALSAVPLRTDTIAVSVLEAVREAQILTNVKVQAPGGTLTMRVAHAVESSEVTRQSTGLTVVRLNAVNLRQKAGSELAFVTFEEQSDHTELVIDASDLSPGESYDLILESVREDNPLASVAKTDTVTITTYGVVRDLEPPSSFTVSTGGPQMTLTVPHARLADEVATQQGVIVGPFQAQVRQKAGHELYFVSLVEQSETTLVQFDGAEGLTPGDSYSLVLETTDSATGTVLLTDTVVINVVPAQITQDDSIVESECLQDGVCKEEPQEDVVQQQLALLNEIDLVYDPETTPLGSFTDKVTQTLTSEDLLDNKEQLDRVLGALLGVPNVKEAIQGSERVAQISDDTDLKQAATFDIQKYIESLELKRQKPRKETPSFIIEQELQEQFLVPDKFAFNPTGEANFDFGASFQPQEVGKMVGTLLTTPGRLLQSSAAVQSNGDGSVSFETQLMPISQLLKIKQLVKCTLVPGDDNDIDMKGFTWEFYTYEETKLGIKFIFEHPEYISYGEIDSMLIEFDQANVYMPPSQTDQDLLATPTGYTSVLKIPPQGTDLLSEEEVEVVKDQGQSFVIGNLVLSLLLKQTMSMLLGSIVIIQILAHLPLADIYLPANAHQQFDLMISFVSFDYFQPSNYVDFGFTEVPSWSERFEWLGYDNINFVEGMGSIIIFAALSFLKILLSLFFVCIRRLTKRDLLRDKFQVGQSVGAALAFIHGTFFEVLVCVSISMRMLAFTEFLNGADATSIVLSFVFGAILLLYIAYLVYFSLTKSNLWVTRSKAQLALSRRESLKSIHIEILKCQDKVKPESASEVEEILRKREDEAQALIKKAETINEDQFAKFAPLVEDLRTDSHVSMFNNVFITCRRLILLYLAMFIVGHQWFQVLTFMVINLLSISFLTAALPFESKFLNQMSILNEGIALLISYFIAQINNMAYSPQVSTLIGSIIVYMIYGSWVINGLTITLVSAREVYGNFKRYYLSKLRWKYACLRPKTKPPSQGPERASSNQKKQSVKLSSICEEEDSLTLSWEDYRNKSGNKMVSPQKIPQTKTKTVYEASEEHLSEIEPAFQFSSHDKILLNPKRTLKTETQASTKRADAVELRRQERDKKILENLTMIESSLCKRLDLFSRPSAIDRIGQQKTLQIGDPMKEQKTRSALQMESDDNGSVVHDLD